MLANQPCRTEEGRSGSAGAVLLVGAAYGRVGGIKGDQGGALVPALAEQLATYSQPSPEGLVFTSTEGGLLRRSNFHRRV